MPEEVMEETGAKTMGEAKSSLSDRLSEAVSTEPKTDDNAGGGPQEPEAPKPTEEPTETPKPTEPSPADLFELEYNGKLQKMTKNEAQGLIRHLLRLYEQSQGQPQEPKKEEPPAKLPDTVPPEAAEAIDSYFRSILKPLQEEIEGHRSWRQEREQREMVDEAMRDSESAMGKHDVFKDFEKDERQVLQGMVMYLKGINPDVTWESASKRIADIFSKWGSKKKGDLIKSKIEQAARRVDGPGGSPPSPGPEKLTMKDLWNGKAKESALKRAMSMLKGSQ